MWKNLKSAAFLVLILLIICTASSCVPRSKVETSRGAYGIVSGRVVQARERTPIEAALVSVPAMGVSCRTDEMGNFELRLPEGTYEIHAAARGYIETSQSGIKIASGKRAQMIFEMLSEAEIEKIAPLQPAPTVSVPTEQEQLRHLPRLREEVRVLLPNGKVVTMDIEEYLRGVVPREMSPFAPLEALKAQAVATRCFANVARWHKPQGAHLCTTTHCQVWSPRHYETTDRAVEETRDIVATYQNAIIEGFYFGHCDGRTRDAEDAGWDWFPYFRSVRCDCGYRKRWGHGVGMCQSGAEAMARQGKTFEEILTHYFTGVEIVRGVHVPELEESIVESKQPDGRITAAPAYEEIEGDFYDSTAKSGASGTKGQGSRFSTNRESNARVRFVPAITQVGIYDVYVTAPNYDSTFAENTRYKIVHNGEVTEGTLPLTRVTCGSRWYLVLGGVEFGEDGAYIEFSEQAPQHDRFVIDAVKFALTKKRD